MEGPVMRTGTAEAAHAMHTEAAMGVLATHTATVRKEPAARLYIGVGASGGRKGLWAGSCAARLAAGCCCPRASRYTGYSWADSHTGKRRWSSLSPSGCAWARCGMPTSRYRQSLGRSAHTGRCPAAHTRRPPSWLPWWQDGRTRRTGYTLVSRGEGDRCSSPW